MTSKISSVKLTSDNEQLISLPMKIDIVPLVVLVFCIGVAVSALASSEIFRSVDEAPTIAQAQQ